MTRPVLALFFVSGAAGLVFETAWTRLYRDLFGQTLRTTSAVIASFLLGLAIGAALGGRLAGRTRRPLRWYALLEIGLALVVLLSPAQMRLADALLGSSGDFARWVAAFFLLLLPTTAMGATLPLLTAALEERGEEGTRAVASLYASNTAGAVAGAALAGFVLLRHVGVTATLQIGAAGSVAAGLAALLLSWRRIAKTARPDPPGRDAAPLDRAALLSVFAAGFAALGWEIVWIRLFSYVLGSSILSFSTVVAIVLASVAAGSAAAGRLWRLTAERRALVGALQLGVAVLSLAALVPLYRGWVSARPELGPRALLVACVVAVPCFLMGAFFPSAVALHAGGRGVAGPAGRLYAALAAGNVIGALLTGHVLVPRLGAAGSVLVLAAVNLAVAAAYLGPRRFPWCAAALVPCALAAAQIAPSKARARFHGLPAPHARVLDVREGELGTVTVLEVPPLPVLADDAGGRLTDFGRGYRLIAVDGSTVAGTAPDLRTTQRLQAHLPLLLHGNARAVLQIGYGSGETAREVAGYRPELFDLAEINPAVLEEADRWFAFRRGSPFTLHEGDARDHVRRTRARYDAILNDSTYPGLAGSSPLYSTDHFRACRARLRPDGILSTWVPVDLPPEALRTILASFHAVFPESSFWLAANGLNKHGVLVGTLGPLARALASFRSRPWPAHAAASLAELGYSSPELLAADLLLDAAALGKLVDGAPLNSDDHPRLEYPSRGTRIAGEELWVETLEALRRAASGPREMLAAQGALLAGRPEEALSLAGAAAARLPGHPGPSALAQGIGASRAQRSWTAAMDALSRGDVAAARGPLDEAVALCPDAAAPRYELGRILLEARDVAGALPHLEVAVARSRAPRHARLLLGDAYLLSGRAADAEREFRAYLEGRAPEFGVLAALGDALLRQGRRAEALEALRRADALRPGHAAVRAMISEAERR